jgi:hypothetical protein
VLRIWDRGAKFETFGPVGNLTNGGSTKFKRPRLFGVASDKLDDPEHLIAKIGVFAAEQTGKLIEASMAPDPSMQRKWDERARQNPTTKNRKPSDGWRIPDAIDRE